MKQANNHQLFLLDKEKTYQDPMPFFMQPIMGLTDGLIFGFEILFRGATPLDWRAIDHSVIEHLCDSPPDTLPIFFVNISHQAFLDIAPERFLEASRRNRVYFEMGAKLPDAAMLQAVTEKIETLSANGVLFANDDYGRNNQDMPAILASDCICAIKVDGILIQSAMIDAAGAESLRRLVAGWRAANITSIAERIETAAMLEFARQTGFDYAQGFHIDALLNGLDSQDLNSAA